mmetsp:Transcript_139524/g.347958  ORF Transcript_139524/g.347958 Transcript_139524/m.347958 type:complete len:321 (+) Transcript_139524:86-1048(+)
MHSAHEEMQGSLVDSQASSRRGMEVFQKTRLCRFFRRGRCLRGPDCCFAHGREQLRAQPDFTNTRMCTDFLASGGCKRGSDCTFAHHPEELRTGRPQATANVSMADGSAIRDYIGVITKILTETQMKLQQLQSFHGTSMELTRDRGALKDDPTEATKKAPSVCDDELYEPISFSRQSTEEGGASLLSFGSSSFSRQTSYDNCDLNGAVQSFSRQTTPMDDEGISKGPLIGATALKVVPLEYSVQHGVLEQLMTMTGKAPESTVVPLTTDVDEVLVDLYVPDGFKASIRNTFIHIEPVSDDIPRGAHRRALSAPPARRSAP